MLRPKPGARPGALVRNVMLVTLIKMAVVMVGILFYSLLDMPDPTQFALATYLIYAAFTAIWWLRRCAMRFRQRRAFDTSTSLDAQSGDRVGLRGLSSHPNSLRRC